MYTNNIIEVSYSLLFLHFEAVHFRCASVHCTDCSPHIHDVLKPCQPIKTAVDMGPTHGTKFMHEGWKSKAVTGFSTSHMGV